MKKHFKVLVDDVWYDVNLSKEEYKEIKLNIDGISNYKYDITLNNKDVVDVGIIDDIIEDEKYNYKLYCGDCIDVMDELINKNILVDLIVTSPPYDDLRSYDGTLDWNFDIFKKVADKLYRVTKEGGVVVWVVGDKTHKGSETGTSFRQALYFKEIGFNLHDTMIYIKRGGLNSGSNKGYIQKTEYMFVFSKGKLKTFNPIEDRENKYIETRKKLKRKPNGDSVEQIVKTKPFGRRHNYWIYDTGKNKGSKDNIWIHPATFPEKLAEDHILSWSNEGDLVLDCFMGSGTTGKMSLLNNRRFIGIEKVVNYYNLAQDRINKVLEETV